jgi:hypothetical protein
VRSPLAAVAADGVGAVLPAAWSGMAPLLKLMVTDVAANFPRSEGGPPRW